jgi:twitching motility protein PilT
MSRLDHVVEYLFSNPGATLVLDSNATGVFQQPGHAPMPVFRQALTTGQILLLFADLVPREQSNDLLGGAAVDFAWESPHGRLLVRMVPSGAELHVEVRPPAAMSSPTPVPQRPASLLTLIAEMPERRATTLHLFPGRAPVARVDGALVAFDAAQPISKAELFELFTQLARGAQREELEGFTTLELSHVTQTQVFHVLAQQGPEGLSAVVRCLPRAVPKPGTLGLPAALVDALQGGGLWVMTGGAGQGTSTTLAAVTQAALATRPLSVLTVESPIEYVLAPGLGVVRQLEVGLHVSSTAEAFARARGIDADLVCIADLEAPDALPQALRLVNRGRLVLGGCHARTAVEAVWRLHGCLGRRVEQLQLAQSFRGLFAQALVPNTTGGASLVWELLPGRDSVRSALRDGALDTLEAMRSRSFDESLVELVLVGDVEPQVALSRAANPGWVEAQLRRAAHPQAA